MGKRYLLDRVCGANSCNPHAPPNSFPASATSDEKQPSRVLFLQNKYYSAHVRFDSADARADPETQLRLGQVKFRRGVEKMCGLLSL